MRGNFRIIVLMLVILSTYTSFVASLEKVESSQDLIIRDRNVQLFNGDFIRQVALMERLIRVANENGIANEKNIKLKEDDDKSSSDLYNQYLEKYIKEKFNNDPELYKEHVKEQIKPNELLFLRPKLFEMLESPPVQIPELSNDVFSLIESMKPNGILFDRKTLYPFDNGGTCSAMALDFAARYENCCGRLADFSFSKDSVISFEPYYNRSNSTFVSRQSAFNTIVVSKEFENTAFDILEAKIQSLANYHDLILIPMTEALSIEFIEENKKDLEALFTNLEDGLYVIRGVYPKANQKKESYGHTMTFIKLNESVIFYDNSVGAVLYINNPWDFVREHLLNYYLPLYRIYQAGCKDGFCSNLSDEVFKGLY